MLHYQAPRWLKGQARWAATCQTIWPALYSHPRADQAG